MRRAGDYLSKFNKLTPPNDALRRAVAQSVSTVLNTPVNKGQVRIQNSVAFVALSNVAKHKMRLERRAILELIFERMPKAREYVRDLR